MEIISVAKTVGYVDIQRFIAVMSSNLTIIAKQVGDHLKIKGIRGTVFFPLRAYSCKEYLSLAKKAGILKFMKDRFLLD